MSKTILDEWVVVFRDENNNPAYGCSVPYPEELIKFEEYDFSKGLMFFVGEPIKNTYLFYNVSDVHKLHSIIKNNGWDKVTKVEKQPWGGTTFNLTTIDGTGIKFNQS